MKEVSRHFQQYISYTEAESFIVVETRVRGENHRPAARTDKLYHVMLYPVHIIIIISGDWHWVHGWL